MEDDKKKRKITTAVVPMLSDDADEQTDGRRQYARVLLYGYAGGGKSSTANTAPDPRLLLEIEPNARLPLRTPFADAPRIYYPEGAEDRWPANRITIRNYAELKGALSVTIPMWVKKQHENGHTDPSIIVDSITEAARYVEADITGNDPDPLITLQERGQILSRLKHMVHELYALDAHVVWIAGAKSTGDGQKIPNKIEPDLPGSFGGFLARSVFAVLFCELYSPLVGDRVVARCLTEPSGATQAKAQPFGRKLAKYVPQDLTVICALIGSLSESLREQVLAELDKLEVNPFLPVRRDNDDSALPEKKSFF